MPCVSSRMALASASSTATELPMAAAPPRGASEHLSRADLAEGARRPAPLSRAAPAHGRVGATRWRLGRPGRGVPALDSIARWSQLRGTQLALAPGAWRRQCKFSRHGCS